MGGRRWSELSQPEQPGPTGRIDWSTDWSGAPCASRPGMPCPGVRSLRSRSCTGIAAASIVTASRTMSLIVGMPISR